MLDFCFPNEQNMVASLMNAKQTFIKLLCLLICLFELQPLDNLVGFFFSKLTFYKTYFPSLSCQNSAEFLLHKINAVSGGSDPLP